MKIPKPVKAGALCTLVVALAGYGYYLKFTASGQRLVNALLYDGVDYLKTRAVPPYILINTSKSNIVFEGNSGSIVYESQRKDIEDLVEKIEKEHNLEVNLLVREDNTNQDPNTLRLGFVDRVTAHFLFSRIGLDEIVVAPVSTFDIHGMKEAGLPADYDYGLISVASGIGIHKFLTQYGITSHGSGNILNYDKSNKELKNFIELCNQAKAYGLLETLSLNNLLGISREKFGMAASLDKPTTAYVTIFTGMILFRQKYDALISSLPTEEREIARAMTNEVMQPIR